jgi:hypothetical protein
LRRLTNAAGSVFACFFAGADLVADCLAADFKSLATFMTTFSDSAPGKSVLVVTLLSLAMVVSVDLTGNMKETVYIVYVYARNSLWALLSRAF